MGDPLYRFREIQDHSDQPPEKRFLAAESAQQFRTMMQVDRSQPLQVKSVAPICNHRGCIAAQKVLERLSYMPGWGIEVYCNVMPDQRPKPGEKPSYQSITLQIYFSAVDATNPSKSARIMFHHPVDCIRDVVPLEAEVIGSLRKALRILALHEVDEWLRCDGQHVVEPHPEKLVLTQSQRNDAP